MQYTVYIVPVHKLRILTPHFFAENEFLPSHQINQYLITASELLEEDSALDLHETLVSSVATPLERIKVIVTQLEGGLLDLVGTVKEKVRFFTQ